MKFGSTVTALPVRPSSRAQPGEDSISQMVAQDSEERVGVSTEPHGQSQIGRNLLVGESVLYTVQAIARASHGQWPCY